MRTLDQFDSVILSSLDAALECVADASFCEGVRVTPLRDPDGDVVAWHAEGDKVGVDGVYWTYEGGLDVAGLDFLDHSRLMESYEHFDRADHIRRNLAGAIEALEEGARSVCFAYVIVDTVEPECLHPDVCDEGDCQCDPMVGWCLVAV